MTQEEDVVEIYADGACSGNPGPGGWGTILEYRGVTKEISGYNPETTNNRMELTAVLAGLRLLKRPCRIRVVTDSSYVVKGMTEWIDGWRRRHWINASKKPVLNRDLWEELLVASSPHSVEWRWIKGHDGHEQNERCDRLARQAIEKGHGKKGRG